MSGNGDLPRHTFLSCVLYILYIAEPLPLAPPARVHFNEPKHWLDKGRRQGVRPTPPGKTAPEARSLLRARTQLFFFFTAFRSSTC